MAHKIHVFRPGPHQDVKKSISDFERVNHIKAEIVVTCVGSLEQCNLRYANKKTGKLLKGFFEIVSLTGTFSDASAHLHISVADNTGKTLGGHLLDENLIYTTAEIAVAELNDVVFERQIDPTYGYRELVVVKKNDAT